MRIVHRYLLREFARIFMLAVAAFVLIYLVADFLEKVDDFMEVGIPWTHAALFFVYSIPTIIFYITPVSVLVGVLVSVGLLARNSEIVALKAGGYSLANLSLPLFGASLVISLGLFTMSEVIMPFYRLPGQRHLVRRDRGPASGGRPVPGKASWFRTNDGIFHIGRYDVRGGSIEGVSIYRFAENFILRERIEAAGAERSGNDWELRDGIVKTFTPRGEVAVKSFKARPEAVPEIPDDLSEVERASEELTIAALRRYIQRMEQGGYDTLRYRVDLQLKFAFPFICTIMALIGLPIAFWKEKGGGIALGVAAGVLLSFLYLVLLGLCRSLGYAALLPPVVAAWFPGAFYAILGVYLFTFVRQ